MASSLSEQLDVEAFFSQMGEAVYDAWLQHDFNEDEFSQIAVEVCSRNLSAGGVAYWDILKWLSSTRSLPYQRRMDQNFGQPSVTLYWTDSFLIEALFWHTGTTAIHQHGFSGAFCVLEGSSVHTTYEFKVEKEINSQIKLGSSRLVATETLQRGDVRAIGRGSNLVHSLFHLDLPSVTVVIRTSEDRAAGPEYVYSVPGVVTDPAAVTPLLKKQIQALELLIRMKSPSIEQYALALTEKCNFFSAFHVLLTLRLRLHRPEIYDSVLRHLQTRFPEYIDSVKQAIEEERRRSSIADLRKLLFDPDQRFFLALLMNLSAAPAIYDLIHRRYPGADPVKKAYQWILDISDEASIGITFDASLKQLLQWMLEGASRDAVKTKIRELYGATVAAEQEHNASIAYDRLSENLLLRALFR